MSASQSNKQLIPAISEDNSLYAVEKLAAHEQGLLHLAVSAFVFDMDGALLIQKRADTKYHCGGLWANSCCTHPHWGESLHVAVMRRLREELGFVLPLEERQTVHYRADVGAGLVENERVTLYRGAAPRDMIKIRPDPNEVSETRWIMPADLRHAIAARPDEFTPWFRIYVQQFPELVF